MKNKYQNKYQNKYCLLLTFKCNWDCSYCITDTHNQPEPTKNELYKMIDNILDDSVVSFAGGEPGMADKELLLDLINKLKDKNCDLQMDTNGLFLKKYPELIKHFSYFFYHCSDTLEIKDFPRYNIDADIDHVLVATDKNKHLIRPFLEYNNDIIFHVHRARTPYKDHRDTLSTINALKLYNSISKLIHHESRMHLIGEVGSFDQKLNIIGLR